MLRSLNRDIKHAVEKEQVIKLIRTIIEVGTRRDSSAAGGTGIVPLSEPIMRALIAVAEHPEEPFRSICTQTLSEIRAFCYCNRVPCTLSLIIS
jgi:rapamycin-insensitive companion of mTOR